MKINELTTPALVAEGSVLRSNLAAMASALPGDRLRPHVKAHKCTALARLQAGFGQRGFTCATIAEMEAMAAAGLGEDLLLANEVADATRLGRLVDTGATVTLAVDSEQTIDAAAGAGVQHVLIDVNVGLPVADAILPTPPGSPTSPASRGLEVKGVMGYEGHIVGLTDRKEREAGVAASMSLLTEAHSEVGGEIISAGGTGTYDLNTWATEIQAGSYALMDTAYGALGLPFGQALGVLSTVISSNDEWAVCDAGLKSLGMDHGNPAIEDHRVWFCSDEHITFDPPEPVGTRLLVIPAHVDPTVAYHSTLNVTDGEEVLEQWPVDMRGW